MSDLPRWQEKGFAAEPGPKRLTTREETWFGVYGGRSSPLSDTHCEAWFLRFPPRSASEAELLTNAAMFGNALWRVETLLIPAGVCYWEGRVEHERHFGRVPDRVLAGVHQVYVTNPWLQGIRPIDRATLQPDVFAGRGSKKTQ